MTQDSTQENKNLTTNIGNESALGYPPKVDTSYQNAPTTAVAQPAKGVVAKIELVRLAGSKGRAQDKIVEVVEVLEDNKYHVKNINPPHDSFIVEAGEIKDE